MDVALGVAVTGPSARLALLDFDTGNVLDESDFALLSDPAGQLHTTIAGTHQSLRESDHRLVATRVYWPDQVQAERLAQALAQSGVSDVRTVSGTEAATALVRGAARHGECALLFVDEDTATLSIVGADAETTSVIAAEPYAGPDPGPACAALLRRLAEEPGAATGVYLVATSGDPATVAAGLRSQLPLAIPEHPAFAIARGAATAAQESPVTVPERPAPRPEPKPAPVAAAVAAPAAATVESPLIGSQLAYSMAYDSGPLSIEDPARYPRDSVPLQRAMHPLSYTSDPTEVDSAVAPAARPQVLLVGSAVAAVAVVALAGLAVWVAMGIRPPTVGIAATSNYETDQGAVGSRYGPVQNLLEKNAAAVIPAAVAVPDAASDGGFKVVYSGGGGGGVPSVPVNLPAPLPPPPVEAVPAPGLPAPNVVLPPFKLPPPPPIIVQLPPPGPIKLPPPPVVDLPPPPVIKAPPPPKLPPPPVVDLPPPPVIKAPPPPELPPPPVIKAPPAPKLPPPPVINLPPPPKLPPPPVINLPPPPKLPKICVPMLPCVGG
ncbi:hypothetical protein [Mycobacterium sp. shizuoka-1]|uniref:hypothetical protein n=1 Tax=Mycobacterium sp. shizuoka-1 TaxID=2039281 RepID=UPI000C0623AF|nr:hypothetical protein [Mycobacterium sp. shizuoka-1]GAY17816.1 hypothetical protein MSZK_45420 [Mycobacterium sp. shizuoka-1]